MKVENAGEVTSMQRGKVEENLKDQFLLQKVSLSPQEWNQKKIRDTQFGIYEMYYDTSLGLSLGGIYTQQSKSIQQTPLPPLASSSSSSSSTITPYNHTPPLPHFPLPRSSALLLPTQKELVEMKRINNNPNVQSGVNNGKASIKRLLAPEPMPSSPSDVPTWAAASASKSPALCRAIFKIKTEHAVNEKFKQEAQSMFVEHGAGSSVGPEKKKGKVVTWAPSVVDKSTEAAEAGTEQDDCSKKAKFSHNSSVGHNGFMDHGIDVMQQMPTVATTGNGPSGTRVEGFLYKYTNTEVSIVCVCHGYFLDPKEFILHAGGNDVQNPMRHIIVCSSLQSQNKEAAAVVSGYWHPL